MRLKDALAAISKSKKERDLTPLTTVWSERADDSREIPLTEYPRPQMEREQWECLNGWWEYAITKTGEDRQKIRNKIPVSEDRALTGRILVPFSPETSRSGVQHVLQPEEILWYRRTVEISEIPRDRRLLLHFDAVDERCKVWWNGRLLGSHRGGYLPFSFDVTDYIRRGKNELCLRVRDLTDTGTACRGKQKLVPGGMFYTSQSGIWKTVWIEWVPEHYVKDLRIIPHREDETLELRIHVCRPVETMVNVGMPRRWDRKDRENTGRADTAGMVDRDRSEEAVETAPCSENNKDVDILTSCRITPEEFTPDGWAVCRIRIPDMQEWSPENPILYPLTILSGEDRIRSYAAMRSVGVGRDSQGKKCLLLNGKPYFFHGVLDQGYWPESLMTPPADEAMIYDIRAMKKLGFNMLRKHVKIESMRWYYHCDRLGMLVWQDMVNGGGPISAMICTYLPTIFPAWWRIVPDRFYRFLSRGDRQERVRFVQQLQEMVDTLYNSPSIVAWVPFNEGWGQFDAKKITKFLREWDPSRLIDSASGWFDRGCGDIHSVHNYFRKLKVEKDSHGRPFVLSEYGGMKCGIAGHRAAEDSYGYRDVARADFAAEFRKQMSEIQVLRKDGMAGAVYTQVSDIEEEINGLLTYDRKVNKCR